MPNPIKNHGFSAPVEITADQYHVRLGSSKLPREILNPERDWDRYLPAFEKQYNDGFESYGCTVFGTLNAIETAYKFLTGEEHNYSDRFTYITSHTAPPGNDPQVIAETVREVGIIAEDLLPFSSDIDSMEKFIDMQDRLTELLALGLEWLKEFTFGHEWIFSNDCALEEKQRLLLEHLQYGPICVSVRAWEQRENGLYYKQKGAADSHWCLLVKGTQGKPWTIFDTYPTSDGGAIKALEWDYDFLYAKRYYLAKKKTDETGIASPATISILARIWQFIVWLFNKII